MLEQLIEKLLENGLHLNGEQPDTVLEQGITVDDIEVDGNSIQFDPDTISKITGNCKMHGKYGNGEPITVTGRFTIEVDNDNRVAISYDDFM